MSEKHVSLFYKEGASDKEYRVHLLKDGTKWKVQVEYGRRSSSLTLMVKGKGLSQTDATEIFNDLVHSKKLKGYGEEAGTVPYIGSEKADRITGVLPQLLNDVEDEELEVFFANPDQCMQEKKDGKRILIRKDKSGITGINRKGLSVGLPADIVATLDVFPFDFIIDGELIGDNYYVFDVLEWEGIDTKSKSYLQRLTIISEAFVGFVCVHMLETARTEEAKRSLFNDLKAANAEGVVFKDLRSPYIAGRPASGGTQRRYKWHARATVSVSGRVTGKRSVYIAALEGKELRELGKVTILPNFKIPKIGTLVEVKYLYRHIHGALYQPVYLGPRDDKDTADQISTMKLKQGIEEIEEE